MKIKNISTLIGTVLILNQLNAAILNPDIHKPKEQRNLLNVKSVDDENGIRGKLLFSTGIGYNIWGDRLDAKYSSTLFRADKYENEQVRTSPIFNFSIDYGIIKNLSAGVSIGYQKAAVTYLYYGVSDNVTYTDNWTRIHTSVRVDYHILAKEKLSLYTGLKYGYNNYSVESDLNKSYPNYNAKYNIHMNTLHSVQAHLGFSYYFNKTIGLNAETGLGIGGPYLGAIGLAIKI